MARHFDRNSAREEVVFERNRTMEKLQSANRRAAFRCVAILALLLAGLVLGSVGCAYVPKTQYNVCETQARILNEQSKAQLAEISNLKTHTKKLEDQLLQAERELAASQLRSDSDRKRVTNFQVEREKVQEQVDGLVRGAKITGIVPTRDDDVEQLAKRFPLLRFDSVTGAYKLDADLLFDGPATRIAGESEKLLTEFAQLCTQPEARDLRIMVVGRSGSASSGSATTASSTAAGTPPATDGHRLSAERALAVADFLRKVGLKPDQIGVSGLRAGGAARGKDASQRVDIFVMGKKTPIVGWDESFGVDRR
jgi:outer membrane protein OmpA-like peptidoglycan-associated protein